MRKMKAYVPKDDFEFPKAIDKKRFTAVLIRQSDHKAEADHIFSREGQLKLVPYAMRLRGDETAEWVRVYDEGAGVSGQKRIDQREELNRLYADIKAGIIGSLVIMHEDRLFRDEFHTVDTTFIELLAKHDVLLFVRTDHRRYDCTKKSDRKSLLDKLIASRDYLDDHVLYEDAVKATTVYRRVAMQASPPPIRTTPAPTRLFYDGSQIRIRPYERQPRSQGLARVVCGHQPGNGLCHQGQEERTDYTYLRTLG